MSLSPIGGARRHLAALWGRWWFLPWLPLLYAGIVWLAGDLRAEHLVVGLLCIALGYAGQKTSQFLADISPYILVAIGYDVVRYGRKALLTPDRVLGCELRALELTLFPVGDGVTVQDYFAAHHAPGFDLLFAVPYMIFAYLALAYAAYLYFVDRPRMRHYLWSFAIANYLSFAIWLILPAAPPWYLRDHGCAIDLSTAPSAAGLLRVDEYLGTTYFQTFYSRAASVFGALPSMHCAYPVLGLLTARHAATWRTWPLHIGYTILMLCAAVYLDHHWIVDAIAGFAVALVAVVLAGYALKARQRWREGSEPTAEGVNPASEPVT